MHSKIEEETKNKRLCAVFTLKWWLIFYTSLLNAEIILKLLLFCSAGWVRYSTGCNNWLVKKKNEKLFTVH